MVNYRPIYVHEKCRKPISDTVTYMYTLPDTLMGRCYFSASVVKKNVVVKEESPQKAGPHRLADIHCAHCGDLIGYKFIAGPTPVLKEGDFLLIPKKLKLVRVKEAVDEDHGVDSSLPTEGDLEDLEAAGSSRNTEGQYESLMINEGEYISSQENLGRERFGCCSGITGTGWCSQQ